MRVKSEIWVKAYIRRCAAASRWAVVARRGDPDAGSIYVRIDLLDGHVRLFGPPPGSTFDDSGNRRWIEVSSDAPLAADEARAWLDRRMDFDPDIWIVDLESPDGASHLDDVVTG